MKITKSQLREMIREELQSINEEITAAELKAALRGKPYDIQTLSQFFIDKVNNFTGLGYTGYNVYTLNFKSNVEGLKTGPNDDGKRKKHSIDGKNLKSLAPELLKKSGKATLVYKVTKEPVFKPGMTIMGDGYWIIK
jgi:hypothetical protein